MWFKFVVTNTGNVQLSSFTLNDNQYQEYFSGCTIPDTLNTSSSFDCIIGPFTAKSGRYTNTAYAPGIGRTSSVEDSDVANYVGHTVTTIPEFFSAGILLLALIGLVLGVIFIRSR